MPSIVLPVLVIVMTGDAAKRPPSCHTRLPEPSGVVEPESFQVGAEAPDMPAVVTVWM